MLRPGFSSCNGASVLRTKRHALVALCKGCQGVDDEGAGGRDPKERIDFGVQRYYLADSLAPAETAMLKAAPLGNGSPSRL